MIPLNDGKTIMKGDICFFRYDSDPQPMGKHCLVRIYGKLDEYSCSRYMRHMETIFVCAPAKQSVTDLVEQNRDDFGHCVFDDFSELNLTLEWGEAPEGIGMMASERLIIPAWDKKKSELFKKHGLCPRCGDPGSWKMLALSCPFHGMFI